MPGTHLDAHPIHLGLGATAGIEPQFTGGPDWYEGYEARHAADGTEGPVASAVPGGGFAPIAGGPAAR